MKKNVSLFAVLLSLFTSPALFAQIDLTCELQYNKYILFEPILVKLTVRNTGPRPIALHEHGKTTALLSFEIKNNRGYALDRSDKPLLEEPMVINPHSSEVIYTYINNGYIINKVDSYKMSAVVRIGSTQYTSPRQFFDVYQGVEVQKLSVQQPDRHFTLRKLARSNVGTYLFLRVDDKNGKMNYGVHPLDRMLDVFNPQMIIDTRNRVHVLFQRSPRSFMHQIYTPEGQLEDRTMYASGYGQVGFRQDEYGNIRISGVSKIAP
jgi:hypothetical protein